MDWQTAIALGIALLCGLWVLWRWSRPLFRKNAGCHLCDECSPHKSQGEFLQITHPDSSSLN